MIVKETTIFRLRRKEFNYTDSLVLAIIKDLW